MTGSGDPAFVKNFNPYTGDRPAERRVRARRVLRAADHQRRAGGGHTYPWLAQSWKWSNGNKTLTLNLAKGVKWSDGKPLTVGRRRLQPHRRQAGQDDGQDRLRRRPTSNVASVKASGAVQGRHQPEDASTRSSSRRSSTAQFVVPQHIWSKVSDSATFTNPNPVGSGPFNQISRFTTQDYVFSKNPHYWKAGAAEDRVPRVRAGRVERRRAAR